MQLIRIAARRPRELMVFLAQEELSIKEAEWAKEEDVDLLGGFNRNFSLRETPVTIVPLEQHFSSTWEINDEWSLLLSFTKIYQYCN